MTSSPRTDASEPMMSSTRPSASTAVLGIVAGAGEGQHGDARQRVQVGGRRCTTGRQWRGCRRQGLGVRQCGSRRHAKNPHRIGDVLHLLFALVFEAAPASRPLTVLRTGFGHRHAARVGQALQARGDVDAVAIHAAVGLLDHVAEMHADAKAHAAVVGDVAAGCRCQSLLDRQRGLHRRGGVVEHRQNRIARHVDDAPVVLGDLGAEDARAASSAATVPWSSSDISRE